MQMPCKMPTTMTEIQDWCFKYFTVRDDKARFVVSALLNAPLEANLRKRAKALVLQEWAYLKVGAIANKACKDRRVNRSRLLRGAKDLIKAPAMNVKGSRARHYMLHKLKHLVTLNQKEAVAVWVMTRGMAKSTATSDVVVV